MTPPVCTVRDGDGPIVAVALHHGHHVRPELASRLRLTDAERLREEDPYTGSWTRVGDTAVVAHRSRFEVDLNRPREAAVYGGPDEAWGLEIWGRPPGPAEIARSLAGHDAFYRRMGRILSAKTSRFGGFVVLDLHSYNHRREGPDAPPDDPAANPEVNLGTGSLDRQRWAPVVERFLADLRAFDFRGRRLDVRENVKFYGANLAAWTHRNFDSGCVLAVEFKKFFMDEWTGRLEPALHAAIGAALESTVPGLRAGLRTVLSSPRRPALAEA